MPILRKKDKPSPKYQGSRRGIFFLLLITVLLSLAFWLKSEAGVIWERLSRPKIFTIKKEKEQELIDFLGIKPSLKDLSGVEQSLQLLLTKIQGKYGVYFFSLDQEQELGLNQDQVFNAASVNKIPIMISFFQAVEQGELKEDQTYILKKEDIQDYGTGSLRYQEEGIEYTLSQLLELAGKQSDNTASHVLSSLVDDKIEELLTDLNMEQTSMEENTTTPEEMGFLLKEFYQGNLVTQDSQEKLLLALTDTDFENRIPQGIPDYIKTAHKIGNEAGVFNDCGIVLSSKPYILCILTKDALEKEALEVLPKISRLFWEFSRQ